MAGEILVFSDQVELSKELLGKARQEADRLGWRVSVLPGGQGADPSDLAAAGADIVYQSETVLDGNPETATNLLASVVSQAQPDLLLVGATKLGMEVAPRVAERSGAGYAAWATAFEIDPQTCATTARCMLYTGLGQATYTFKPVTAILSIAPGVFQAQVAPGRTAQVVPVSVQAAAPRMNVVAVKPKAASGARLEEAKLVLDVGQGVKQREDLEMVQALAALLDGQLACSRPVASDRDWFPEWLGLSGKKVRPELCLTLGVSGAIQHIVGIRDSHLIAAVNMDENAGIFTQADYGVVADLYQFLPALIEALKARGVRPAWS